jgi:predicted transposase YbfD/YdcC
MSSLPAVLAGGQLALLSRRDPAVAAVAPVDLLEALGQVPDPRDPRGRRYRLVPVLAIAVCAVLAGARSYAAIAEWAADAPPRLRARLGLGRTVPDLVTIWRVLTAVDPAALDRALGAWVNARLAAQRTGGQVVLAVDGKTVRGARTSDGTAPHLMACLEHGTGVVLAQAAVDGKNERNHHVHRPAGSGRRPARRAGHRGCAARPARARHLAARTPRPGHGQGQPAQPAPPATVAALERRPPRHVQDSRGHGRIEKRIVKAVTVTAGLAFPHAAQAIQITRRTRRPSSRKWRTETSYAVTSLPAAQARPDQLAKWIRGHWKIENQLHWVRDVTFGEDASTARTGTGPHVMATVRNLVISILRLAGHISIAAALRHTARHPMRAFRLLTGQK